MFGYHPAPQNVSCHLSHVLDAYYQQTFGTAMGSPVSVIVANLVMEETESQVLSTFTPAPRFWKQYVNNTCTVIPSHLVTLFHDHLNGVNEHIQFTLEMEVDSSLPFLDACCTTNQMDPYTHLSTGSQLTQITAWVSPPTIHWSIEDLW